jgi:hypothetical protein
VRSCCLSLSACLVQWVRSVSNHSNACFRRRTCSSLVELVGVLALAAAGQDGGTGSVVAVRLPMAASIR